ncbi:MAG: DSD1 family PLP-dependent enzyme [Rhodospirillaceae bacterium]|nr:DSD1 family PLP-dependent enzyme [Rhodospirillaceae bacterium]MBT3495409.1 DSD1 family PLP-dependent enzyme [Rhodospirillaceae bacterium]MBT3782703.1 DSD1 family PLP-dependent enzyme [Rhodospirillaceae bacterium]MBT3975548.1 DSD1 family PLP-dependent enzyme [Rhodospirillaceae bacterium]MBT4170538.1 DSD1 family PLP-dependent enzyme [Rhodospirillaceae bacterium]
MSNSETPNSKLIGQPGSRWKLLTPALILDLDVLEANIAAMAAWAKEGGFALRPHGKSHKSPDIARRQAAAGAVGLCCASLREAQVMAAHDIKGLLITTPLAPGKAPLVIDLIKTGGDVAVVADHAELVAAYGAAAAAAGVSLDVFVDLDVGLGRTGTPSADVAIELAGQISAHPALNYAGVQGYMGHLQHVDNHAERRGRLDTDTADLQAKVDALIKANLPPPVVSGGGTGTHRLDAEYGSLGEFQVGSYLFMDVQYLTVQQSAADDKPYGTSLFVQTSVVNINHPGYAVTDAGLKSFATDGPFPIIACGAPAGASYRYMGDEHGAIDYGKASDRLGLGDKVECIAPHCDPNVNLFNHYHVVRGDTLVEIWPVAARGNS